MYSVDSLKYHILSFRVCGLWPNLNGGWLYDCWSALFLICVAFGFPLSQLVCVIFVDSVDGVVEQLLLTSTVAIASAKGFNIYIQKRRLAKLFGILNGMDDELAIDSKSKYKEVFDPLKKIGTVLSFMFLGAYGTAWAILAVQVILSTPEKRAGWSSTYLYPSEYLHKPSIYVGGLFYQGASNLILCAVDAALDTMPVILLNILVGHIEMLKILLREIDTSGRFRQESTQHQALVRVCKNYQKIENASKILERTVSFAFLAQFGVSGIVLCTCAYQLTVLNFNEVSKFAFTAEYMICMISEIFVPTYFGSLLRITSESLPLEIYKTNWMNKSQRYKTSMMILTERTLRPISIAAGSVFGLNLSTLLQILKTAYSLLACLKNV